MKYFMGVFMMKRLVLVVAVSIMIFQAETREYYIRNLADDSFSVSIVNRNPNATITPMTCGTKPLDTDSSVIVGCIEQSCGKSSHRKEKRYNVIFMEGYVPSAGEEPYISFSNDKGEFRLVFFEENYAELHSDTTLEIHDNPERRAHDHFYTQSNAFSTNAPYKDNPYNGGVQHWIVFGSYMAVYCYERYNFALRAVDICDWSEEMYKSCNFRIEDLEETECDKRLGIEYPTASSYNYWKQCEHRKQCWRFRLCNCCID
jgi:hypothetical protein